MKKWKNDGFDMKFIGSCQIQAKVCSNGHIFQNSQISIPWALKNSGRGPFKKISSPGHEKTRHMPCSQFQLLPRIILRQFMETRLNFMPGMKI